MFTGIIQGQAIVENKFIDSNTFSIKTDLNLSDCKIGSSISCDGICLTVTKIQNENSYYFFNVNISEETIKRTTARSWDKNSKINLEKSLKVGDEISGHFVYGHVDTVLNILKIEKLSSSWNFYFSTSFLSNYNKFIVEKGSIAINGISLTIANAKVEFFDVSIIPHTYNNTNLSNLKIGDSVNVEFDLLAKYIHSKNGKS